MVLALLLMALIRISQINNMAKVHDCVFTWLTKKVFLQDIGVHDFYFCKCLPMNKRVGMVCVLV